MEKRRWNARILHGKGGKYYQMKKVIFFLSVFWLVACTQTVQRQDLKPSPQQPVAKSSPPGSKIPIQKGATISPDLQATKKAPKAQFGTLLSDITVSSQSFNPSQGDKIALYFKLAKDAVVTVKVYDPDGGLVKTLLEAKRLSTGKHSVIWDGRDMDGRIVPDEAYFFTVLAQDNSGHVEIYDPTTFSGGIEHDITSAEVNPVAGTIVYRMPEMGRVMIRIGIKGGPLLNQLVDWEPRVKGLVTEYWNGKDKDNLMDLYDNPRLKIIITYFTLPENSVISFGNKKYTFREYKKRYASNRPQKPKRDRRQEGNRISLHYKLPRTQDYSPRLKMSFSNIKGRTDTGIPILSGKTVVKVELSEEDKLVFENQQFEICFFLDNEFYAEDETGYTPFNWVWDLSDVPPGEHFLTVNISSFKDQVGVLTRKVYVW